MGEDILITRKQARRIFYERAYKWLRYSQIKREIKKVGFCEILLNGRYGDRLLFRKCGEIYICTYGRDRDIRKEYGL